MITAIHATPTTQPPWAVAEEATRFMLTLKRAARLGWVGSGYNLTPLGRSIVLEARKGQLGTQPPVARPGPLTMRFYPTSCPKCGHAGWILGYGGTWSCKECGYSCSFQSNVVKKGRRSVAAGRPKTKTSATPRPTTVSPLDRIAMCDALAAMFAEDET